MAEIKIDYDGITSQMNTLFALLTEYEGLNSRMKSLSSSITDSWEGEAAGAFSEMMGKYSLQAQNLERVLEAFRNYMNQTSARFESVDQECANLISNSF